MKAEEYLMADKSCPEKKNNLSIKGILGMI
jgi:hypothetical protein